MTKRDPLHEMGLLFRPELQALFDAVGRDRAKFGRKLASYAGCHCRDRPESR